MEALTLREINDTCTSIINNSPPDYPELRSFFTTAYTFGLRWIEIFELHRWSFANESTITVKTAKRGNPRELKSRDVEQKIIDMIISEVPYWELCRYNTIRYYAQHYSPYPFASCGKKEIGVHIFRHCFVKNLADMGITPEEIQIILGERTLESVNGYIKSNIFPQPQ